MQRHVDLCSGIGGFALGFQSAGLSSPVLFCDNDAFCQKVIRKHWPDVPIANDVKELADDPERNVPDCDVLSAGYPCQPFSLASKQRKGTDDERHIWPYIKRIISVKRPNWCVFENVKGHISLGLDAVINDLHAEKYTVIPMLLPAYSVGAIHERARVYIVAYSNNRRGFMRWDRQLQENAKAERCGNHIRGRAQEFDTRQWREIESRPFGVAHGIPDRVDRIKSLGNSILPAIAQKIGQAIVEMERGNAGN